MIAYGHCLKKYGSLCRWLAFIDADEFIVPKTFTGSLPDFLVPYEQYGGIGINWLVFGSNGHIEKPASQIESYTRRLPKSDPENDHVKSIVQPRYIKHIPSGPRIIFIINGESIQSMRILQRFKGPYSPHSTNKIQLNHYWLCAPKPISGKS